MDIGTLILMVPVGASTGIAIMIHEYLLFIPAGILLGLAVWWERQSRKFFAGGKSE